MCNPWDQSMGSMCNVKRNRLPPNGGARACMLGRALSRVLTAGFVPSEGHISGILYLATVLRPEASGTCKPSQTC